MKISKFFVGREKKPKGFFTAWAFVRPRGCRSKLERKGDRKRAGEDHLLGRIGVKGLHDFRRGLGKVCPKN